MTWIAPLDAPFTVEELVGRGCTMEEACSIAWGVEIQCVVTGQHRFIQPPQVVQVVNQYGYRKWVAR